jgi:hypothetical protein
MAGWGVLDFTIAAWGVVGFVTFTIAGMFQMPRIDKQTTDAIGRVLRKEEGIFSAFAPGRIGVEIDSSTSGIIAGIGFAMATSGVAAFLFRISLEGTQDLAVFWPILWSAASLYALFYVVRGVLARLAEKSDR